MLELAELRIFGRIAELGSISGAARALRMPKSSVSRSLVRLEAAVGAMLVERSTRHLRLTDAGLLLQRHARRILDEVGEAENAIGGLVGLPKGDLRVSVPFTLAAGPLAAMMPGFMQRFPEVRVVLNIDNRVVDLATEDYDIAIRIGPMPDSDLIARRLTTIRMWICASPGYLADAPAIATALDLRSHRLIAHGDGRETWRIRSLGGANHDVQVEPGTVVPEPNIVRTMLLADAGIAVLPDFHAADAVAAGLLVRLFPDFDTGSVEVHAVYQSRRSLSARVRVFIDAVATYFEQSGVSGTRA